MVIANVFPKLMTVKMFVRPLCKKCHLGTHFDSQHVKVLQILAKSQRERFFHVFSSFWEKFISKNSPVLISKILGIFLNTLTAKDN